MGDAMTVVMVVMMGGMLVGSAWAFIRRRRRGHHGE
jgi:LPXTG-motif cell wall-anchored protein